MQTPLYVNAYYLMANTAVNSLSGFAFWMVAARLYSDADVGIASATVSAMMLIVSLSSLGLGTGLIRYLPRAGESARLMLDSSLTLLVVTSVAVACIFLVGLPIWSPSLMALYNHPTYLVCFLLSGVVFTLGGVVSQVFIARRAAKLTLLCSIILGVTRIFLLIPFAAQQGSFGIFVSVGIAAAVMLVIALIRFLPTVQAGYFPRVRLHAGVLKSLIAYSVGNQAAALLAQIPQVILPMMVLNILGPSASAYSYTTWMLANALFMISGAISTSTFAEGANEERLLGDSIQRAWKLTLLLSIPAILLILIAGDKLLLIFGREYARNGAGLLAILALSAIPVGVNNIYLAAKMVTKEINVVFRVSLLVAGGTIGFGCLLMPRYGIAGAGIGWLLSQEAVTAYVLGSALLRKGSNTQSPDEECVS